MSPLRLSGSTSGFSQLDAPAVAGDQLFTLPGTGGVVDTRNRAGNVIQVVNYQTGAVATGTTTIPADDTIPQNTEGTEFMTLAITPTSASNKLLIQVSFVASYSVTAGIQVVLFQDSTANGLAQHGSYASSVGSLVSITFSHYMTAGTTSATTFKVRAGAGAAGTITFNGSSGARFYGGALASSIIITEIAA